MAKLPDTLNWNVSELAGALKITEEDVKEYFTDGRRVSFIIERRIAHKLKATLAPSEKSGYDLIDRQGRKWEVRSITKQGVYFNPSNQVGKGRTFERRAFLRKLSEIEGYILADIVDFPKVTLWKVSSKEVRKWWNNGTLGTSAKISRKKALGLID